MDSQPAPANDATAAAGRALARAGRGARIGFALGVWFGLIEGALALRAIGPLVDRLGTMSLTILVDGAALAALAALGAALLRVRGAESRSTGTHARVPAISLLSTLAFGLAFAAWGSSESGPNPTNRPHIVLVSIDTLRADHLSAYGYPKQTSPRLDALAREGVLFVDAMSHSTWTLPAHVSMFTGLDPAAHGVLAREHRIQPYHHTLAERLREAGYATSAWVGTRNWGFVGAVYGFDAGFDRFLHYPHPKRFRSARLLRAFDDLWHSTVERGVGNASDQITSVIHWLSLEHEAPVFTFVHLYDVHSKSAKLPYEAPPPFRDMFCEGDPGEVDLCDDGLCASDRLLDIARGWLEPMDEAEIEWARCLYDGGIRYADHEVGRLVDAIDALGIRDETIVIVTSDHGEGFFEHGYPLHSTLHQEVTRIPLIIRSPGAAVGKRASGVVRQSDLLPTVLDLAGLPIEGDVQGRSLVPLLTDWGATSNADVLAFDDGMGGVLLRAGSKTLIQYPASRKLEGRPDREYYDLSRDPTQKRNLERRENVTTGQLQLQMAARLRESAAIRERLEAGTRPSEVEISEEAAAGLRALGYVVDEEPSPAPPEADE